MIHTNYIHIVLEDMELAFCNKNNTLISVFLWIPRSMPRDDDQGKLYVKTKYLFILTQLASTFYERFVCRVDALGSQKTYLVANLARVFWC